MSTLETSVQVVLPSFLDRTSTLTEFGEVNEGVTNSTQAFKKAIEACSQHGGRQGKWFTGPLHLQSHMSIHFEDSNERDTLARTSFNL